MKTSFLYFLKEYIVRKIPFFIIFCLTIINFTFAGCGPCNVSKKQPISPNGNFVTSISEDRRINGLVLASCGMCNFGMKDKKRCSLAIQINDMPYDVKGTGIDDHGDSHAKEGFCNAIRVANVKGEIIKNTLKSESFVLLKN